MFPIAAVASDQKLTCLQQHKFIFFQFRKSEVQDELPRLTPGCYGLWSFLEALEEYLFLCLFQLLDCRSSWARPPSIFRASNNSPSPSHISTFSFFFCLFYLTQLGIFIILLNWIQSDNPGYYSHLSVLNHICRGCWYHIR